MSGSPAEKFDLDVAAAAMEALSVVSGLIHAAKQPKGEGHITCPRCGGRFRYAWATMGKGSRKLSYAGQCETDGCIRFSGH